MKQLVLLPLTAHRSLLFCQTKKIPVTDKSTTSMFAKANQKFQALWHEWEHSKTPYKHKIVGATNKLLSRVPYEEWSLRSLSHATLQPPNPSTTTPQPLAPPLTLLFPSQLLTNPQIKDQLLGVASRGLLRHKKYGLIDLAIIPITIPFGIVPIIPNIPGYYLAYRLFCHYKAYKGAQNLNFFLNDGKLQFKPSLEIFNIYKKTKNPKILENILKIESFHKSSNEKTQISTNILYDLQLLDSEIIPDLVKVLEAEEFEPELHRALEQILKNY